MKHNLPERVLREISSFARKHSVTKVVLFGSRARGTNTERSDIDEMILLIRDSFLPAFAILEETLKAKLKEAENDWN